MYSPSRRAAGSGNAHESTARTLTTSQMASERQRGSAATRFRASGSAEKSWDVLCIARLASAVVRDQQQILAEAAPRQEVEQPAERKDCAIVKLERARIDLAAAIADRLERQRREEAQR